MAELQGIANENVPKMQQPSGQGSDETTDVKNEDVFKIPTLALLKCSKGKGNEFTNVNDDSPVGTDTHTVAVSNQTTAKADPVQKVEDKDGISVPYKEPKWSAMPQKPYCFEIIKNGVIVDKVDLSCRPFTVCGRLTKCDIVMEHPSISRFHAIIQYRSSVTKTTDIQPEGFYLFDLDSTHGTQINKNPVKPRTYYKLHVGHMIKFGGSSRSYILHGPSEDEEEESQFTVTEIKEMRIQELKKKVEEDTQNRTLQEAEEEGISWGMSADAEEEEISDINPFALDRATNEESYFDDPKKTLRGWFEREGYELEYKVEEVGQAQFVCRVELPVESAGGKSMNAEAKVKGKKKEAVIACALEACRILDRQGVLRKSSCPSRKVKKKNWEEEDYYDSDDDTFLDRTGTIERKRQQRLRNAGKTKEMVETYESLLQKHTSILEEISELEKTLFGNRETESNVNEEADDSLEAYMKSITSANNLDKTVKTNLKLRIAQLKFEEKQTAKLIKITKPALPPLIQSSAVPTSPNKVTSPLSQTVRHESGDGSETNCKRIESSGVVADACDEIRAVINEMIKTVENDRKDDSPTAAEQTPSKPQVVRAEKRKEPKEKKAVSKRAKLKYEYDSTDPNYAMWMPPEDQSGDGKTKLNERFGY